MTLPHTETITTFAEEKGERLDILLAGRLDGVSRSRLKALILAGHVIHEAAQGPKPLTDPGYRIAGGETIAITVPPAEPAAPEGENIPLNVVYEDDQLIVIDKPRGLVVHPAAGNWTGTLVNALIAHCGETLSGIGGVRRPGIVHRLDKDTTGLMVVAKTDKAHKKLAAQFADHGRTGPLTRGYLAFVWGAPDRPRGTVDAPLDRHPHQREKQAVRQSGREAITHWELRETYRNDDAKKAASAPVASLIACKLETGRTHQIRVHMAHVGHPLLGDETYGTGFKTKIAKLPEAAQTALGSLGRQALHAYLLGFEHPVTGEHLEFESKLPADLGRLRDGLKS
ncbi:ribosomal large subunit pseudouridine synthase D [Variibacter gotjawalensis]|uniref:Pseudouridine synthase n=1 Tax=Variibacter gotjawalensis TaxID=1333996 RepID=A0A0S3Q0C0_9BRAD|nr:RluA family pseudouridine synthase [Variibacter gotjawalensis]NIK47480.1 23S rRNA pseudouridine1911/1915/1917 synthase [Variibacter gotjawalensis]RZS49375.1 ribosomal large subunit pseudouridine synthase D [Variibacter gotjawalensis]BAT61639.1 ribosomal large subunit pseudouridine synthase D [Variibacter gotjawalensis]